MLPPDPCSLFRDACRCAIARCQALVPTFQEALDDPTLANVDHAADAFTDLWECARSGDSAVVGMHKLEVSDVE